jgi:hypothetical protein
MALTNGQDVVDQRLLVGKFKEIVPISQSNPDMVAHIRKWGKERAVPASHTGGMEQ